MICRLSRASLLGCLFLSHLVIQGTTAQGTIPAPASDPFYAQPSNITQYKAGQVIRTRNVTSRLQSLIWSGVTVPVESSYQYLYRTNDDTGKAVAAATTLLIPLNADPSKLLSYQTAYDSIETVCNPSYGLRAGLNNTPVVDNLMITAALKKGWYVVTPDYEGVGAQFYSALLAGRATLDSVRAVRSQASINKLKPQAKQALWGISLGTLATAWAAAIQPSYAPELRFTGAVLLDLIGSLTDTLFEWNYGPSGEDTSRSGLSYRAVLGLARSYPGFNTWFQQSLNPGRLAYFRQQGQGCLTQLGGHDRMFDNFADGSAAFNDDVPKSTLRSAGERTLATKAPGIPIYLYKGLYDVWSQYSYADGYYQSWCASGTNVQYLRDSRILHDGGAAIGGALAFPWIADRLNGVALPSPTCTQQNVSFGPDEIENHRAQLGSRIVDLLLTGFDDNVQYPGIQFAG